MSALSFPGERALRDRGWWFAHRYLILRRISQVFFLLLFLTGPWFGVWIAKGTLASSLTFDFLPLTDPFILLQSLTAGHIPETTAFIGAAIVIISYILVGGRSYCAWVCPINPVTDAAAWVRHKLGLKKGWKPRRWMRLLVLAAVLVVSGVTGMLAWELVNPITSLHRAIIFGGGFGFAAAGLIFMFDVFTANRGFCGHLCPVGAFYGTIGAASVLRVSASNRKECDMCMDCFEVCPEPQVISLHLRGEKTGTTPVIMSGDCLNCGRCIDVCSLDVFQFTHRFNNSLNGRPALQAQTQICKGES